MSKTSLPLCPIDVILGKYPRHYLIGDKVVSAAEIDKMPDGYIAAEPVKIPDELTQESVLKYQMTSVGAKEKNGIPIESIKIKDHTPDTLNKYITRIKSAIAEDIMVNGVPLEWGLEIDEVQYKYREKLYVFKTETLKVFDELSYPSDILNGVRPTGIPNLYNLAERPLVLPCISDNKFTLFTAQHKAGSQLLQKYVELKIQYQEIRNNILQCILDYEFDKNHTMSTLWQIVYGTEEFYGDIDRVKI